MCSPWPLGAGYGSEGGEGTGVSDRARRWAVSRGGSPRRFRLLFRQQHATGIGLGLGLGFGADGFGGRAIGTSFAAGGGLAQAYYLGDGLGTGGYEHSLDGVPFYDNSAFGLGFATAIGGGDQGASDVLQFGINQLLIGGNISPWPGYGNGPLPLTPLGEFGGYPYDIPSGGAGQAYARAYGVGEGGGAYIAGGDTQITQTDFGGIGQAMPPLAARWRWPSGKDSASRTAGA